MSPFIEMLESRQKRVRSLLCVGLDPQTGKIPAQIARKEYPIYEFNRNIIEETNPFTCSYKPQVAYYSGIGAEKELKMTIDFLHERFPDIPVILDAKRGDIGPTAEMYAREAFDRYNADAVTVNPYMGFDSIKPFTDRKEKGVVVLCKTSNPHSGDFQDLTVDGTPLYLRVAEKARSEWNYNGNVLLVAGATYPSQIRGIRAAVPEMTLLVPGVGAQGGSIREIISAGLRKDGLGIVINSSRAIIHASSGMDFAEKARAAAEAACREMREHLPLS